MKNEQTKEMKNAPPLECSALVLEVALRFRALPVPISPAPNREAQLVRLLRFELFLGELVSFLLKDAPVLEKRTG
jgi:hypothetical protein